MRILGRYIVKEIVGPTFLGFCFYTFVILMNQLFRLAEMIIRRSLPASTVLQLLGLSLPHVIVLTIPMALLFGVLIAVGRLSSDSEIIAMRSVGVSTTAIYRPVFYVSFIVFILNLPFCGRGIDACPRQMRFNVCLLCRGHTPPACRHTQTVTCFHKVLFPPSW